MPSFTRASTPVENVFAGTRDDLRNDLHEELVAVSGGAAVVGLEDEPSVGGGERGPLVPVGVEVVAVGVGGASVDEGEHGQMLGFEFARRINQHAFDGGAVVGLPVVGLALREIGFGEVLVEGRDGAGLIEFVGGVGEIDFFGLAEGRIDEGDFRRVRGDGDGRVGAGPSAESGAVSRWAWWRSRAGLRCRGGRRRGRCLSLLSGNGVMFDGADEILGPLLDLSVFAYQPSRDAAGGRDRGR